MCYRLHSWIASSVECLHWIPWRSLSCCSSLTWQYIVAMSAVKCTLWVLKYSKVEYKSCWTVAPTCWMSFDDSSFVLTPPYDTTVVLLWKLFPWSLDGVVERNMYASLLGCYWFHVIMLHDVVVMKLEVWISFQPAFDCMWSSLCREARCSKLKVYHLGCSMTSFHLLLKNVCGMFFTRLLLCCYGGLLHGFHFLEGVCSKC